MKGHGKVGKRRDSEIDGIADKFRAGWDHYIEFASEGERLITRRINCRDGCRERAGDVD